MTALHKAAQKGHAAVCKMLLEAGADPDAKDKRDRTPRSLAAGVCSALVLVVVWSRDGRRDSAGWSIYVARHLCRLSLARHALALRHKAACVHPKVDDGRMLRAELTSLRSD